jgi:subtilisin family serine protease
MLAAVSGSTSAYATTTTSSSVAKNYLVLYKSTQSPSSAASDISAAGGTLVANYSQIGVAVAQSSSDSFAATLGSDSQVDGVVDTSQFGVRLNDDNAADTDGPIAPPTPAPGSDSLSGLQWDMNQIHAPEARAINGGSSSIVVGDIDTGLDFTHPDLAPNVDFADSASCIGGVPDNTPAAWNDDNGHGTHTAGTIAAAKNGIGIVGVAPNVRIAGIKAGDAAGFFFPEAVVCAFMWAGTHNINVTNNSYFADPWLFNCKNDPGQRAIWKAERRAIDFAQNQKVLVVAAEGNQSDDLAHPTADATSPDDTTPVLRQIHNDCAVVPVEVSGVVGVTAAGHLGQKSFYSSYGVGTADVMAPGGDSLIGGPPFALRRVLSTYPAALMGTCARPVVDASGATYCYLQGTSMASPHVAGLAALIESMGITNPSAVTAKLQNTADPVACPSDMSVYDPFPALDNGAPQVCQGGAGSNSFAGKGQINALTAVS